MTGLGGGPNDGRRRGICRRGRLHLNGSGFCHNTLRCNAGLLQKQGLDGASRGLLAFEELLVQLGGLFLQFLQGKYALLRGA